MGSKSSGQVENFYSFTVPRLILQKQRWKDISRGQADRCLLCTPGDQPSVHLLFPDVPRNELAFSLCFVVSFRDNSM